jgi:hypothetical protein
VRAPANAAPGEAILRLTLESKDKKAKPHDIKVTIEKSSTDD